jgi:hypothetical protein
MLRSADKATGKAKAIKRGLADAIDGAKGAQVTGKREPSSCGHYQNQLLLVLVLLEQCYSGAEMTMPRTSAGHTLASPVTR